MNECIHHNVINIMSEYFNLMFKVQKKKTKVLKIKTTNIYIIFLFLPSTQKLKKKYNSYHDFFFFFSIVFYHFNTQ
jgi:hypothetical protein